MEYTHGHCRDRDESSARAKYEFSFNKGNIRGDIYGYIYYTHIYLVWLEQILAIIYWLDEHSLEFVSSPFILSFSLISLI